MGIDRCQLFWGSKGPYYIMDKKRRGGVLDLWGDGEPPGMCLPPSLSNTPFPPPPPCSSSDTNYCCLVAVTSTTNTSKHSGRIL